MHCWRLDRFRTPDPAQLTPAARELARRTIAGQVRDFLARGGRITHLPSGATSFRGGRMGVIVDPSRDSTRPRKTGRRV